VDTNKVGITTIIIALKISMCSLKSSRIDNTIKTVKYNWIETYIEVDMVIT
jgi:hypothetical protein